MPRTSAEKASRPAPAAAPAVPAPDPAAACSHGVPAGRGCAQCAAVHPAGPHRVDERHPTPTPHAAPTRGARTQSGNPREPLMDSIPTSPAPTSPAPTSPAVQPGSAFGVELGPHAAEFQQLVAATFALSPAQQAALEREYPSRGDDGTALAVAFDALAGAGRMAEQAGDPVWDTIEDLDGIAPGSGSAAAGILARDLVDAGVFRTLTFGWRSAGLGLPGEPVPSAPRPVWGWRALGRRELAARLLAAVLALVAGVAVVGDLPSGSGRPLLILGVLAAVFAGCLGPVVAAERWED